MTAPIVQHGSRAPFPAELAGRIADEHATDAGVISISVAGDENVKADIPLPAGQLWERVAEQSESYNFTASLRFRTRRILRELAILNGETR